VESETFSNFIDFVFRQNDTQMAEKPNKNANELPKRSSSKPRTRTRHGSQGSQLNSESILSPGVRNN
jgi:hypothetical protein